MIDWLMEPFQHPFNQRAILAALLIGFTNGYASAFVVLKKSALKVGSLSHALLPGIALAILVTGLNDWSAFLGSLFAALGDNVAVAPPMKPVALNQDQLLQLVDGSETGAGITLEPATDIDMRGKNAVIKPSLEVVYDEA
jgi:ABC-type Mn2+/Zn2+ transport system permease subunit